MNLTHPMSPNEWRMYGWTRVEQESRTVNWSRKLSLSMLIVSICLEKIFVTVLSKLGVPWKTTASTPQIAQYGISLYSCKRCWSSIVGENNNYSTVNIFLSLFGLPTLLLVTNTFLQDQVRAWTGKSEWSGHRIRWSRVWSTTADRRSSVLSIALPINDRRKPK